MTLLTDYLLVALSLQFSVWLWRLARQYRQTSLQFWTSSFLFTAVAAAMGGTFHMFTLFLADSKLPALWNTIVYCIGIGSSFVLSGAFAPSRQRESTSLRWLLSGVAVSIVGHGIQQSGIVLHRHLNHNDLYHIIQMVTLFLFYRGVRLFRAEPFGTEH